MLNNATMNTTDMRIASNRVRDIEHYCHQELDGMYGHNEVRMFVRMLFERFLGWDHATLLSRREETINQSDLLKFHWAVEDLRQWRPIQYIVGWTDFCGCQIAVDERVLIPRPETEEMVLRAIELWESVHGGGGAISVLDLCTGSGCIAIAMAKHWPGAQVTGVDISAEALAVARKNADTNGVDVLFELADILEPDYGMHGTEDYGIIVSNPPYVRESERDAMQANVTEHEPEGALYVADSDPLVFYKAIARIAQRRLARDGMAVTEINEALGKETLAIFEEAGFQGHVEQDFRGKQRTLVLHRKNGTSEAC